MAILADKYARCFIEISPVTALLEGPHNAYHAAVREQSQIIFERQYSIDTNSPDGHWHIWRLFRALQFTGELAGAKPAFNLTGLPDGFRHEAASLGVDVGWLHVILVADTLIHKHGQPESMEEPRCFLTLYLLTGAQENEEDAKDYRRFELRCLPSDVVEFGRTLEAECREALRLRREMGLLAPADDYIDDYAED